MAPLTRHRHSLSIVPASLQRAPLHSHAGEGRQVSVSAASSLPLTHLMPFALFVLLQLVRRRELLLAQRAVRCLSLQLGHDLVLFRFPGNQWQKSSKNRMNEVKTVTVPLELDTARVASGASPALPVSALPVIHQLGS